MMKRRRGLRDKFFVVSFLAPALVLYGFFVLVPFVQVFWLSLYQFRGFRQKTFVGFEKFQLLWTDEVFWIALRNGLILVGVGGPIVLGLALLLGSATSVRGRGGRVLRSVYLLPQVVSVVAVGVVWRYLVHPRAGIFPGPANGWLGDTKTAFWVVVAAFVWSSLGFYVMLFGAGLAGIPREVDEAAALEGVSGWKKFWIIAWPMLWAVRRVAVVYVVIHAMNCFALVNVMLEKGGPANSAEVMLNYLFELMQQSDYGRASALAVVNFVVALGLSLVVMFIFRRNPEDGVRRRVRA